MIYMATTKIDPVKTAGEIMELLSKHNVRHIITAYEGGEIVGLSFSIVLPNGDELHFKLPVRWEPVLKVMARDRDTPNALCKPDQAKRVAWRQILRWVEAQLALVATGMADIKEIFMPYFMVSETKSLYENFVEKHPALTAGAEQE